MVPDVVEELVISSDAKSLDQDSLRMKLSEPDEHALEQAILLKEKYGGKVTVAILEAPEVDEILFSALAKGADRVIKITGNWAGIQTLIAAKIFSSFFSIQAAQSPDSTLLLTGSQALDDLDGELAPYLSEYLSLPYIGVVTGVSCDLEKKEIIAIKEFAGGMRGKFKLVLPAVLGIQSSEKPPRYVPVAKVRSAMKSGKVETMQIPPPEIQPGIRVEKLFEPTGAGKAEMIEGPAAQISAQIAEILLKRGLI
jgi:electron transfer flavoprotein beta subunit